MEQNKKCISFDVDSGRIFQSDRCIAKLNYSERLILECLMQNSGEIVSKDKLLEVGWPNRVVVPNSLNIAIRTIRAALQSAGVEGEPETVPRHGYKISPCVVINYKASNPAESSSKYNLGGNASDEEVDEDVDEDDIEIISTINNVASTTSMQQHSNIPHSYGKTPPKIQKAKYVSLLIMCRGKVYFIYFLLCFIFSFAWYLKIILHKPTFLCSEIMNVTFCGSEHIDKNVLLNNNADFPFVKNEVFWFSEVDGKYDFIKVD